MKTIRPAQVMYTFLLGLVGFLTIYPLIWLLYGSFWSSAPGAKGHFTFDGYIKAYTAPNFLSVLMNSLLIVGATVIISISLAVFMAWIVTRTNTPGRKLLEQMILFVFFIPPSLTVLAWILLASPETGLINQFTHAVLGIKLFNIFSHWGIIWHMVMSITSFSFMLLVGPFRSMDSTLEEAARTSGDRPLGVFFRITVPILSPAIIGAAILIFIRGLEAFEAPAFIGVRAKITVFATQIYEAITYRQPPQYAMAMATAVTLLVITIICIVLQWWYMRGKSFVTVTGKNFKPTITDLKGWKWTTLAFVLVYFFVAVILPMSQLVISSFQKVAGVYGPGMFTLNNYKTIFKDEMFIRSLRNTLYLSISGALICMLLSAFVSYVAVKSQYRFKKALDFISWIPWTIPGIVLALGMLWGYIIMPSAFNVYGTIFILLIAYVIIGLPLGVRNMSSAFLQLSNDLEESARVHGATWWVSFRTILLALIQPSFISGFFLLFVIFSRELSASILLYSFGNEVLSVTIFSYWSRGRSEIVSAISVIFIGITLLILILQLILVKTLERHRRKKLIKEEKFFLGQTTLPRLPEASNI